MSSKNKISYDKVYGRTPPPPKGGVGTALSVTAPTPRVIGGFARESAKKIIGIDPGTFQSGYVIFDYERKALISAGKIENEKLIGLIRAQNRNETHLVVEMVKSYGNVAGDSLFQTCVWIGQFVESFGGREYTTFLNRKEVVTELCLTPKANDAAVRCALIDRYGAPGTKKNPGPTYGIANDIWSALALVAVWIDRKNRMEDMLS